MGTTRQLHVGELERLPAPVRTTLCAELLADVTHVALDIDGVITAAPKFFGGLAKYAHDSGLRLSIVTSRSPEPRAVAATRAELRAMRIPYDAFHAIPAMGTNDSCPHAGLDWFQRWLWLKIDYCLRERVQLLFDDDAKVIDLATRFAPTVNAVHVVA